MAVRFMEYVQIDGREVSLYIMQEKAHEDSLCFRIQAYDIENYDFILCKKVGASWSMVTRTGPIFIFSKLYPVVTESIDLYLKLKKLYVLPN